MDDWAAILGYGLLIALLIVGVGIATAYVWNTLVASWTDAPWIEWWQGVITYLVVSLMFSNTSLRKKGEAHG